MRIYPLFCLLVSVVFLTSCTSPSPSRQANSPQETPSQQVVVDKNFKRVAGQTIYVPVYSHIYHDDGKKTFNLAATLSIRNTDLANPIIITFVRYYDTNGKLVRQYLEQPIQIDALVSTDFVIDTTDTSGGSGAKFLVEWIAQTEVSEPIIEAVMIGSGYHQGISFISPGKVIKNKS
ncbi:DUF3124 domain-containing protein [Scytonema millei]|uniref:DUF3124 domain-containing protein n=1 Tax=Scytonema millei VB511283 TaxID=1245923 RepID=A0A9X5E2J2_9CYAN|nr:DUF3124 domain-containing protein [Scytonema millei]NHC33877.1 DUF3124 domain-containing protein [Scytonema millei VB511283]